MTAKKVTLELDFTLMTLFATSAAKTSYEFVKKHHVPIAGFLGAAFGLYATPESVEFIDKAAIIPMITGSTTYVAAKAASVIAREMKVWSDEGANVLQKAINKGAVTSVFCIIVGGTALASSNIANHGLISINEQENRASSAPAPN